jgi:hypothetical protein
MKLGKLGGVGPKALRMLSEMGIESIEDLAKRDVEDSKGWKFFGKKDAWKRLVLQARSILLPEYVDEKDIVLLRDCVRIPPNNELAKSIFITNVLELSEKSVSVIPTPSYCEIRAKRTGNKANDDYYGRIFSDALLRVPERLSSMRRGGAFSIDSEQGISELQGINLMQSQFDSYLEELVGTRLEETIEHGKKTSVGEMVAYLQQISSNLYFDSFLSLLQQYALSDTPIASKGERKMSTGFNLAIFGQPGTGKTFATVDLIMGNENDGIPAHGLPGINRYCGGMTVAQFVRIAQAYQGKKFNFIVTEFNDWFKYPGMVENLKQALERKKLRYETVTESIGPYSFDSFFSVNYNTTVYQKGYDVTIRDPNFNAIEDRMVTRLHRMTKDRFANILKSMESHLLSEVVYNPRQIRDHLVLVYAIQTGHPLVRELFDRKEIELNSNTVHRIVSVAGLFADRAGGDSVSFSPRLVKRAIGLCSSMSLLKYFQQGRLTTDEEMEGMAIQFFCEEASVRSQEEVSADEILRLAKSPTA